MISYGYDGSSVTEEDLAPFFVGWPVPPSIDRRPAILAGSFKVVLARDETGGLVGFATAISDGVLSAYVPLLEVLPEFQGRGIGTELMLRLLEQLQGLHMIDLMCDSELVPSTKASA